MERTYYSIDLSLEALLAEQRFQDYKPGIFSSSPGYQAWREILEIWRATETAIQEGWSKDCWLGNRFRSDAAVGQLVLHGVPPDRIMATFNLLFT